MATMRVVVLECDICKGTDLVGTHMISVDGKTVEAEACEPCWQKVVTCLIPFSKAGRVPQPKKVSAKKDIMPFPGQAWRFTAHALVRLGERHIDPVEAAKAADQPERTEVRADSAEVRIRKNVKVIVDVRKGLIVTASKRDELVDNVA